MRFDRKSLREWHLYFLSGTLFIGVILTCPVSAQKKQKAPEPPSAQKKQKAPDPPVAEKGGRLVYSPEARGDRIPDFSYSGYKGGAAAIPDAPIRVTVPIRTGDATLRIQAALDYVGSLPADRQGIRGAVLLDKGVYEVAGDLVIRHSGVVLRGNGMGEDGTILLATGHDRRTLIRIAGKNDRTPEAEIRIADAYVPVNSTHLHLAPAAPTSPRNSAPSGGPNPLRVGDHIRVHRPSTAEWIRQLGMETFGGGISALGWKPGQRDIFWDREVIATDADGITLDAPLTTAIDTALGGGWVARYQWPGRIEETGVENLRCRSTFDGDDRKDEAHSWMAITMENVSDAWIRQVIVEHFAGSAVEVLETANRITVEDCKYLAPVSEIGGQRRNSFITTGGQTLFQRLYSEYAFHDFSVGFCAPGPNAFVQCQSFHPYSFSGAIDSWASGVLFDVVNIDAQRLSYGNREQDAQGAGWSAANSVFWNCTAARIDCYRPPGAQNWSFGSWGQFGGDGYWGESNSTIQPRSFYYAQLADRFGQQSGQRAQILPVGSEGSSSPSVQQAAELIAESTRPRVQMTEWIDQAARRNPITVAANGAASIDRIGYTEPLVPRPAEPMQVVNGWLVRGSSVLTGRRNEEPWWMGSVRPYGVKEAKPAITRYVPGRTGPGLTDDLDAETDSMVSHHVVVTDHNYGLWYDRRRDDHERIRRMDGDVWPPFYELPFARSGRDTAWDGLSKYDLTRYNPWYWDRLKKFADLADEKGLVLIHQNYFQHNIIEAGAHYADFPWRPANNINHTGFPEPPPYAGDKRIFMAEQFYDTAYPVRHDLHRAYIRKCLDNFSDNNGVIQLIAAEFTGPLHFVQFWVDNIRQWEQEKGKHEIIGLSTTKDVQDAILADPTRASVIDLVDIRYWYYQADGKLYAPLGGQNLAPRQHERLLKPKRPSFEQVAHAVREYRQKFPAKAVLYSAEGDDLYGWAVFIAGGSLANIPVIKDPRFLSDAARMAPIELSGDHTGVWALGLPGQGYIIYAESGASITLDLAGYPGAFHVRRIDPREGTIDQATETIEGGKTLQIRGSGSGPVVIWISRRSSPPSAHGSSQLAAPRPFVLSPPSSPQPPVSPSSPAPPPSSFQRPAPQSPPPSMPRLRVSPNGRFLMTEKGDPFFWLGDTGWLLLTKLNREEADRYLENRRQKGFNVIQVMLIHGLNDANVYGAKALECGDLARAKTTPGNTPVDSIQYDYWDNLDYVINKAAEKGMYLALVPVWGGVVKSGKVSLAQARTYAEFLAERYKASPNIVWMNGGDIKGSDSLRIWTTIGATLRANDPGHLITFHPRGRSSSSTWFHTEAWLDFNSVQSGHRSYSQDTSRGDPHYGEDNWKYIRADYQRSPAKPVLDAEPSYEQIPHGLHDTQQPRWTDKDVRRYGYWSVFAGACGFTYGDNSVMQMHHPSEKTGAYGATAPWFTAIDDPGAGQMIILKDLMLSRPYFERVPDPSLVADQGDRYDHVAATRGGNYAFIYTYDGRRMKINMGKIAGRQVRASWYSPRDGGSKEIGLFANTGTMEFDPPGDQAYGNDWVLLLDTVQ